ncbi:MAG: hypothetical protein C5B52_14610 [Bacteroidetes bacterium]|nr:MAG: hypothetical protein C5B52_14610 [Bacteroidota bacterium]
MVLLINKKRTVGDLQKDFNDVYPYLRLEVFDRTQGARKKLSFSASLNPIILSNSNSIEFFDSTIVSEFEKSFLRIFGMIVQVSRKSGNIWLETTITDKWTLKQQNELGKELSTPNNVSIGENESDTD